METQSSAPTAAAVTPMQAKAAAALQEKEEDEVQDEVILSKDEAEARKAVMNLLFQDNDNKTKSSGEASSSSSVLEMPTGILPRQLAYAGSAQAQETVHGTLPGHVWQQIPVSLTRAFGIAHPADVCHHDNDTATTTNRSLYRHQALCIEAALSHRHVLVCTGTGSGKSLGFWVPVLCAALQGQTSLVLFPTKALAQDQSCKLQAALGDQIRVACLDGDTPHAARVAVAESCPVLLTNPDTLHAALLPNHKLPHYQQILAHLQYAVVDEAHMYEGCLGAHVSMILRRLVRLAAVARQRAGLPPRRVVFLAASATLAHPRQFFAQVFPVSNDDVTILTPEAHDGSPRSQKHFFVWNPPVTQSNGVSLQRVTFPRPTKEQQQEEQQVEQEKKKKRRRDDTWEDMRPRETDARHIATNAEEPVLASSPHFKHFHRRHAADETALLLARAVSSGVRCIAFCKTRNLVEWVYERALQALSHAPELQARMESYRGGYTLSERREIEKRLFRNDLLGVVGTNALELGVDIGGIDLTLHCGYPSSYASLLQQAGRAGRGKGARASVSITICFNSPSEQHLWRQPRALLGKGLTTANSIPLNGGLVQGHLLCASNEFPLTGNLPATAILGLEENDSVLCDQDLFGGRSVYNEALEALQSTGSVVEETIQLASSSSSSEHAVFGAHPSMRNAWSRVSIRSIEPVQYSVINLAHPGQGGRMDAIHDEKAVLDTLPYSRVFYHAHPGAVITHRGRKYKVVSMTRPPAFIPDNFSYRRNMRLAAFAKPTTVRYNTRPLSNLFVTVVKQLERVNLGESLEELPPEETSPIANTSLPSEERQALCTLAGSGAVNVKRTVHGYKKLSLITRVELSRSELSLPPMEYDTFGIWIDTDAGVLSSMLGEQYGPGVHALSHALLAVAPLFAPGLVRADLDCDHAFYAPTQVMLFDQRAGGSGASERLWKHIFRPDGLLHSAISLLESCESCLDEKGYDHGCPACIHASQCIKFNGHLSRSGAIIVGKHMLDRIKTTNLYKENVKVLGQDSRKPTSSEGKDCTPRRKARRKALKDAKEMYPARNRQFVVGRPSWPMDGDESQGRQIHG